MPKEIRDCTDGEVDGYAAYRRRLQLTLDEENQERMPTVKKYVSRENKNGRRLKGGTKMEIDNQWIPGYNPALLMKYRCHINVEYCGSIKAINYLYKYIYKGTDQGYMKLKQYKEEKDEIYLHKYGRILTANECHYRIAGFPRGEIFPSVTRLGFFVPDSKSILLKQGEIPSKENIRKQIEETGYWTWFEKNKSEYDLVSGIAEYIDKTEDTDVNLVKVKQKINKELGYDAFWTNVVPTGAQKGRTTLERIPNVPFAYELTYENFGKKYVFDKKNVKWKRRKRREDAIVRLYMGYPGTEYFYLRKLLRHRKGPLSIDELLCHPEESEVTFQSYKEACVALGYVDSSIEYFHCMSEAQDMGFSRGKLLGLFAQMLIVGDLVSPGEIWRGVKKKDNEKMDEIEEKYPDGYAKLMMHFPQRLLQTILRENPRFNYDYTTLCPEYRRQCEQFTLRKLNGILERSGTEYPKDLPKIQDVNAKEQCKEWLSVHNYDENIVTEIYDSHRASTIYF